MPEISEYLIKLPFYKYLNSSEKELLLQHAVIRKYEKGSML